MELVGPNGMWNRDRTAVRHGYEDGEVTLGGRRVQVKRPWARTGVSKSEVPLQTYEQFAGRNQLIARALWRCRPGECAGGRAERSRETDPIELREDEITPRLMQPWPCLALPGSRAGLGPV